MVSWLKPKLVIKEEVLMRVSTNLNSMTAQRYVRSHTEETALEDSKLSSGNRIVSSYVDPAGPPYQKLCDQKFVVAIKLKEIPMILFHSCKLQKVH